MEIPTKYQVKEIKWPEKTFLVKRAKKKIAELSSFFSQVYSELYGALERQGLQSDQAPFAIYYSVDADTKETDLAAAVAVDGLKAAPEGFDIVRIPESKAVMVNYKGPYDNMHEVYSELDNYVTEHKLQKEWVLEQYFSDPQTEKDPAEWRTDIYYIVR